MACFLVPAAEAVITTVAEKVIASKEKASKPIEVPSDGNVLESAQHLPFSQKLKWLNTMLWGGSALLAFEHLWHGEIVPWFPFFTAASDPASAMEMLQEMGTVGMSMALLVTAAWGIMVGAASAIEKKAQKALPAEK